jgi:3'(2'), 5'-bisphosphate nucleotidase
VIKLPSGVDINNLISDLRILSWEAADILLFYSNLIKKDDHKALIIKTNTDEDPVTLADLKVNETIINRINEKYRDVSWEILSEENVKVDFNYCNNNADWIWILDPLDGTKDFIQSTGDYAMHLALNYKNRPYLGIVLIPEKNELWFAIGEKLWCEKRDGTILNHPVPKIKNLQQMTVVTSKNHRNEELKKLISKVNFKRINMMGSVGCKIASIIRGESDIYISLSLPNQSSPKDWDFAAPEAVLKAGGGSITNLDNEELIYCQTSFEQRGVIIASNNRNEHKRICFQLKEIIKNNEIFNLDFS